MTNHDSNGSRIEKNNNQKKIKKEKTQKDLRVSNHKYTLCQTDKQPTRDKMPPRHCIFRDSAYFVCIVVFIINSH